MIKVSLQDSLPGLLNHVRRLLADAVGGHLRVTAVKDGHDADIGNTKALDTLYAKSAIDDGVWVIILAHLARARCMVAYFLL